MQVDQGSLTNKLYSHAVEALNLKKCMYKAYIGILVGFIKGQVQVDVTIRLQLMVSS